MPDLARRQQLANYLKAKRALLNPQDVGLPTGKRRRTPGLRREEVAQLANISTAWYIQLEQAKDIQVSREVLAGIANALQLDTSEQMHLFTLARDADPIHTDNRVSPVLLQMLSDMKTTPAYITSAYANLVAWNACSGIIFGDFDAHHEARRNMMILTFTDHLIRERIQNWEDYARDLTGHFQTNAARFIGDEGFTALIDYLQSHSPIFEDWWQQSNIQTFPEIPIHVQHPDHDELDFTLMTFQMIGGTSLRMCTFVPDEATRYKLGDG